jgi:Leucine-rich repeat (LRR) protein
VNYNTSGLQAGTYNGSITIIASGAINSPQTISVTLNVNPDTPGIPAIEREALIALYNSTNGDNWTYNNGWKAPPLHTDGFAMPGTENNWHGIVCDAGNTYVQGIDLSAHQLIGSMPSELGNLTSLQWLLLYSNELTGSIPSELGNLPNLQYLYLQSNQLTGNIPSELGGDGTHLLNYLYLDSNQLTGRIPPELGNLAYLKILYLNSNELTGRIPTELINLTWLSLLDICDNHLYATDPDLLAFLDNFQPGWEDCQTPPYGRSMPWIPLLLLLDD